MARDDSKARILERAEREQVKFMRLQFTDILGATKNVEVPDRQFGEALDGRIMFDGSSIEGFAKLPIRHLDVLGGAQDVRELEPHELDLFALGALQNAGFRVVPGHRGELCQLFLR